MEGFLHGIGDRLVVSDDHRIEREGERHAGFNRRALDARVERVGLDFHPFQFRFVPEGIERPEKRILRVLASELVERFFLGRRAKIELRLVGRRTEVHIPRVQHLAFRRSEAAVVRIGKGRIEIDATRERRFQHVRKGLRDRFQFQAARIVVCQRNPDGILRRRIEHEVSRPPANSTVGSKRWFPFASTKPTTR